MPKIIDEVRIVAEKIVDLISNSNDAVRKDLAVTIKKVDDRYSHTWTGLFSRALGYRKRGEKLAAAKDDLSNKAYQDQLLQMQTFLKLIRGGATESSSANTRLFKLLTAKIEQYKEDHTSLDTHAVVESLYANVVDVLEKKIKDCENNIKKADQNRASLADQRKIQVRYLENVMVFDNAEDAIAYKQKNPENLAFWLSKSEKDSSWRLFWLDKLNQFNYLKTKHKFVELFASVKDENYLEPGTSLYEQVKTLSYDLLQESKSSNVYLFKDATEARKFANENPQVNTLLFRSFLPAAPALGYQIELMDNVSAGKKLSQKTIYLQSESKDVIRYTLLEAKTLKQISAVIQRHQLTNDTLFDDLHNKKTPDNLQSWQEALVKITAKKGHTEMKPDTCQFSWYEAEGRVSNIDLVFSGKKLQENNQLPPTQEATSLELKECLLKAMNTLIDKVPVVINPEKTVLIQAIELLFAKTGVKIDAMEAESLTAETISNEKKCLLTAVDERIDELPVIPQSEKSALKKVVADLVHSMSDFNSSQIQKQMKIIQDLILPIPEDDGEQWHTSEQELDYNAMSDLELLYHNAPVQDIKKTEKSYMPALVNTFVVRTTPLSVIWYDAHSKKYPVNLNEFPALNKMLVERGDSVSADLELKAYLRMPGFRKDVDQNKQQQVQNLLKKPPTLILADDLSKLPAFKLRNDTYYLTKESEGNQKGWVLYHRLNKVNQRLNTPDWPFSKRFLMKLRPFNNKTINDLKKQNALIQEIQAILSHHEKVYAEKLNPAICQQNDNFSSDDTSIYVPDSFVISKNVISKNQKQSSWRLHYIDAGFQAEMVVSKQVKGLSELLSQVTEDNLTLESLEKAGLLLAQYRRDKLLNAAKETSAEPCVQDDDFSLTQTNSYKPCSFILGRHKENRHWLVYYIDSLNRSRLIDTKQIDGLAELLHEWVEHEVLNPEQLQQLDLLFASFTPDQKLATQGKYAEVAALIENVALSKKRETSNGKINLAKYPVITEFFKAKVKNPIMPEQQAPATTLT